MSAPSGTKISETEYSGQKVEIYSSPRGLFQFYLAPSPGDEYGDRLSEDKLFETAENKAKAQISKRKVKVKVPFLTPEGKAGFATGLHSGNNNMLVKIGTASPKQVSKPYTTGYVGRDPEFYVTDTPTAVLQDRKNQTIIIKAAQDRIRAIDKKYGYDLRAATEKAIDEKLADQEVI